ncbi:MAG: MgtC/SapB family protein [Parachlamydiaceae bacterium]
MDMTLSQTEIIFRFIVAAALGGLIGIERERSSWFAGLRTHMLVCVGSTLIMIVSQYGFLDILHQPSVVLDPSRVAAQVVSGIGFLGAGTILFWKNTIKGLTTAASLWVVAAIGLSIGGGLYFAATFTTILSVVVLAALKPLEKLLFKRRTKMIHLYVKRRNFSHLMDQITESLKLRSSMLTLHTIESKEDEYIKISFFASEQLDVVNTIKNLHEMDEIERVEISE